MKKYDKVWIKNEMLPESSGDGFLAQLPVLEQLYGPVIVLTVKELKELWKTAELNGAYNGDPRRECMDCETFLKSKGIEIS